MFEESPNANILAGIVGYNIASKQLVEKLGFKKLSTAEKNWLKNGKLYDYNFYGLNKQLFYGQK